MKKPTLPKKRIICEDIFFKQKKETIMSNFKFNLKDEVIIKASGEKGEVKARAEYTTCGNQYYIHYTAADGRAVNVWWDEGDISAI